MCVPVPGRVHDHGSPLRRHQSLEPPRGQLQQQALRRQRLSTPQEAADQEAYIRLINISSSPTFKSY